MSTDANALHVGDGNNVPDCSYALLGTADLLSARRDAMSSDTNALHDGNRNNLSAGGNAVPADAHTMHVGDSNIVSDECHTVPKSGDTVSGIRHDDRLPGSRDNVSANSDAVSAALDALSASSNAVSAACDGMSAPGANGVPSRGDAMSDCTHTVSPLLGAIRSRPASSS